MSHSDFFFGGGKSSKKIALNQWYYFGVVGLYQCVFSLSLLKVVGYYDLSVQ